MPSGQYNFERQKNRLRYMQDLFSIDMTHVTQGDASPPGTSSYEVELEVVDMKRVAAERLRANARESNHFAQIVQIFLNNIRLLSRKAGR